MFSSSARRVASVAPSIPIATPLACSASRAATTQALSYRSHQRRYSSSKPSSPADGSKGVSQVPAPVLSKRVGKRKAKDGVSGGKAKEESLHNVPSVPSTQHIAHPHMATSDFFSLYRPLSLTQSFPQIVTDEAFAAIFAPRTRSNKSSEVISTLSHTLDAVTGRMRNLKVGPRQPEWTEEEDELRAAITALKPYQGAQVHHLDASPDQVSMVEAMAREYRPFHPPAPPIPMNTADSLAAGAEAAGEAQETQHITYKTVLTIEESTDKNGDVTYQAHIDRLVPQNPATNARFLERMRARQERYRIQQGAETNGMFAISVKRQRKLKMKKHKYKKLMRKTRNLRRRLDRN
ncbi:hypothetical protein BJ875DRAFT_160576 [Amylocarpus encephaloides]|uniref:Small ribosomal subunit protein mS38 n=1 Tax=Amylocarpus encephaloides TaxID=45428 RepID=A0A9P7YQP1_9HELO|nr:hypothetical protein BJ875DRAFT_160576 [Amylocarpus encephaloides]